MTEDDPIRDQLAQDVARRFGSERATAAAAQIQTAATSIALLEQLWPKTWQALDTEDANADGVVHDAG